MEQMTKKHNETGRSMVEMLGVLAVVGVLSIGGVAGYRYAVDKMNANEIINELKKRAITASQQRVLGQNINLSEYGAILGKYEVAPANGYPEDPAFFGLEIKAVPQKVCQHIVDSDWAMPVAMKVGEVVVGDDTTCAEGANTLTFAFNNTLESGNAGNGGNNDPTDTPTQQCGENEYRLADGTCKEDTKCSDPNQFWNGKTGKCTSCPVAIGDSVLNFNSFYEDSCTKCSNAQQGAHDCVYCPSDRVVCGDTCCEAGKQCQYKEDASTNWHDVYTCVDSLGADECLTNADCNNGSETGDYYCQNALGCTQMIGICRPARLDHNGASIDFYGKPMKRSADWMGWYAAKNFCAAHNMSLLNLRDYCTDGEIKKGECSALAVTNDYNWRGWTAQASSSCVAFHVNLSEASIGKTTQDEANGGGTNSALCVGDGEYVPPVVSTEVTTQTEITTTTATQTQTVTETETETETVSPEISESISDPEVSVSLGEGECLTNADCNNGSETGDYYCKNGDDYQNPTIGTCESVSGKTTITLDNGKIHTVLKEEIGWNAAKSFCRAVGESLVSADRYCTASEWDAIKNNDYYGSCLGWIATGENGYYWTSTARGPMLAYEVNVSSGYLSGGNILGANDYYPLCEKIK